MTAESSPALCSPLAPLPRGQGPPLASSPPEARASCSAEVQVLCKGLPSKQAIAVGTAGQEQGHYDADTHMTHVYSHTGRHGPSLTPAHPLSPQTRPPASTHAQQPGRLCHCSCSWGTGRGRGAHWVGNQRSVVGGPWHRGQVPSSECTQHGLESKLPAKGGLLPLCSLMDTLMLAQMSSLGPSPPCPPRGTSPNTEQPLALDWALCPNSEAPVLPTVVCNVPGGSEEPQGD